jgi:hypothetical protein
LKPKFALAAAPLLTVFDEAEHSAVLQANVHVEVLDTDVHFADSALVVLTLGLEILDHSLQLRNVIGIFGDSSSVSKAQN